MLNDAHGFKKIYIATGYTDLRRGIDGLAAIIRFQFDLDPFDRNTLFLFCGRRSDRIKELLWEGDGFLLMYKRLNIGAFTTDLTKQGIAIVSGMAKGVDAYAQTACLKAGGYTIAVLGNGLDICYPSEHRILMENIAKQGLLISEYEPGIKPQYGEKYHRKIWIITNDRKSSV